MNTLFVRKTLSFVAVVAIVLAPVLVPSAEAYTTISSDQYFAQERAKYDAQNQNTTNTYNASYDTAYNSGNNNVYAGQSYDNTPSNVITDTEYFAQERAKYGKTHVYVNPSTATTVTSGSANSASASGALGGLFRGSDSDTGVLAITKIEVVNPALRLEGSQIANCDVEVHWQTNQPSVGQVLYGLSSQSEVAIDKISYSNSAMTSMEVSRVSGVKLGCLANSTYYFRVFVYGSDGQIAQSKEIMLVPFGGGVVIENPNAQVAGATDSNSASVLSALGRFGIPIAFLILLLIIGYFIVKWVRGQGGNGNGNGSADGEINLDEPAINIASGQS
ncbi:MAG: hypothetical protein COU10_00405 [Candidatus Harrisonbacteria bacterium CG10_big_fil_rev_8_21_14_0_10_45_28]|uniref:Fibronectin type-III domain-containing protein n=1 Tax=Candidatus Harrisonbacteria bacterium CG10_big_fil_rev_8_21_14_0_10_45_28 TaxID=1974586 RepID=A0A2H0UP78_9BACT|nr:MAG: hypothetical protein COU10_00405 [Candidatus Harrisonbacteria bacterium CG10_big_fil_rev_8_21_14_0_10_45_28]